MNQRMAKKKCFQNKYCKLLIFIGWRHIHNGKYFHLCRNQWQIARKRKKDTESLCDIRSMTYFGTNKAVSRFWVCFRFHRIIRPFISCSGFTTKFKCTQQFFGEPFGYIYVLRTNANKLRTRNLGMIKLTFSSWYITLDICTVKSMRFFSIIIVVVVIVVVVVVAVSFFSLSISIRINFDNGAEDKKKRRRAEKNGARRSQSDI